MAVKTEIKDVLLWMVSFFFVAMLWYLGWMYEGMREVFLTAPVVFVMLLLSRRAPWWLQAVAAGITAGAVFLITQGWLKTLLLAGPPSADQMGLVFVGIFGIALASLGTGIVIASEIEWDAMLAGGIAGLIVGLIVGAIAGTIVGRIVGAIVGGIVGLTVGAAIMFVSEGPAGAIVGAILGAIPGAMLGSAMLAKTGGATGGAIFGAIVGAIAGAIFGAIADAIEGAIRGAIVGAIVAGAIAGGAIGGGAIAATGKWFLSMGIDQQLLLLSLIITFVVFSLFLAISALARARKKSLWDYPLFPALASAALFPIVFAPVLKGASALSIPPWARLSLGFGIYGLFFLPLWLVAALANKSYQYFLKGSRLEKSCWEFVSSYPHLLCRRHLTRAKKERIAIFYSDIHCVSQPCDNNSFYKAKKVIGVIDRPWPNAQICRRDGDKLYVNIVKGARETRSIDLDVLEIRYAEDLDYLLQHFLISYTEDHAHHDPSQLRKVPVVLKCKKEDIPRNVYHLAMDKFKTVIEEGGEWM